MALSSTSKNQTSDPVEFDLTPEQSLFAGSTDKKYLGYVSGVGAGKTFAGIARTVANMETWNRGEMGAIVAPTRTMVKDVIISQMREIGLFDGNYQYNSSFTEAPGIHGPDGGRALILSADNSKTIERLRGLNLSWFWVDEEAEVDPRAREILTQRIRVGNYRNGYITTTPKGKNHTYDFFIGEQDGEWTEYGSGDVYTCDDRLAITRVPTHANPHNPDDYIESVEKDHDGQRYEQEVLGDFVSFEGLIYKWFGESHTIDSDAVPKQYDETIYGLDWGGSNPTAIVCILIDGDMRYIVDEYHERRVVNSDVIAELESMEEEWGTGPIYCDHEPRSIKELRNNGFNAKKAEKEVSDGIRHVNGLQDNLRVVETLQNLKNEFNSYQYKDGGDSDKPLKQNDHLMDSLRYATYSHGQGPSTGAWTTA